MSLTRLVGPSTRIAAEVSSGCALETAVIGYDIAWMAEGATLGYWPQNGARASETNPDDALRHSWQAGHAAMPLSAPQWSLDVAPMMVPGPFDPDPTGHYNHEEQSGIGNPALPCPVKLDQHAYTQAHDQVPFDLWPESRQQPLTRCDSSANDPQYSKYVSLSQRAVSCCAH